MTEEALLFFCDEAACKESLTFYEYFDMDERWEIIRAILKVVKNAVPASEIASQQFSTPQEK